MQFDRSPDRQLLDVAMLAKVRPATALARDVASGLWGTPKQLPPKYFYDDRGSELFDRICDTPEYYPTRSERELLENTAGTVLDLTSPAEIVELGSGSARKTRILLDALARRTAACRYVPFDVSEGMLRKCAASLRTEYPWLEVEPVAGDYEQRLPHLRAGVRRLFLFRGGTIGNFTETEGARFLRVIRGSMQPSDNLLVGLDLEKDVGVLHAAYNDAQGLTAEFNKNVLLVINRELGAEFRVERFDHRAFYDRIHRQIEMHLVSRAEQRVFIRALAATVELAAGESVRTEISRKFSRSSTRRLLARSGLELREWFEAPNRYYALALCGLQASGSEPAGRPTLP